MDSKSAFEEAKNDFHLLSQNLGKIEVSMDLSELRIAIANAEALAHNLEITLARAHYNANNFEEAFHKCCAIIRKDKNEDMLQMLAELLNWKPDFVSLLYLYGIKLEMVPQLIRG